MNDMIYVVYYRHAEGQPRLIKAFRAQSRAQEYVTMLQGAPFPGEIASGYQYQAMQLD